MQEPDVDREGCILSYRDVEEQFEAWRFGIPERIRWHPDGLVVTDDDTVLPNLGMRSAKRVSCPLPRGHGLYSRSSRQCIKKCKNELRMRLDLTL